MADEILYSTHGDLRVAAILNQLIWDRIADKVDLRNTVVFADDPSGKGSSTVKIGQTLYNEIMAAVGEGSSVTNSALEVSSVTFAIARQALAYEESDLMKITGSNPSHEKLAMGIYNAYIRRASALISTAIAAFTTSVGTSGVNATVDDFYLAQFALNDADVPDGEIYAVYKPQSFSHFQNSLRGEGGAVQFDPNTRDLLNLKKQGFVGEFSGVQIWKSARITDDGTDYFNGMYAMGAIGGVEASVASIPSSMLGVNPFLDVAVPDSAVWCELVRDGRGGEFALVGNAYAAFGVNEQARGVEMRNGM